MTSQYKVELEKYEEKNYYQKKEKNISLKENLYFEKYEIKKEKKNEPKVQKF